MKAKRIDADGQTTFALVFERGDELISSLQRFAEANGLGGSHLSGIGAFSGLTLGYFERERKDYKQILVDEQVEVLSLTGDIALQDGRPKLHVHVVIGKADGTAHGGHLLEARVWPTLEVILVESPRHLRRRHDEETGLALIDLDAPAGTEEPWLASRR
jgi:uncharacterized protein